MTGIPQALGQVIPYQLLRTVSYRVCYTNYADECAQSDVTIHIIPENTDENIPPVAVTDAALTLPNQTVFSNLLANDIDPDGYGAPLSLTTTPVISPANGTVVIQDNGDFAYTPEPEFTGIDRFRYRVCDTGTPSLCDSAWVYVIVSNFGDNDNKPISASDNMFLHVENGIYSLRENDFALPGENLVYNTQPVITPEHGSLELFPDGTFTYTPDEAFFGFDWFVYQVCNTDEPPVCRQGTGFIFVSAGNQWVELAGRDTTIGNCNPFTLDGLEVDGAFSYSWSPGHLLDDSTSIHPVWQPTETTVFSLTVSNDYGFSTTDSVKITVAEVLADAGETTVLDNDYDPDNDIDSLSLSVSVPPMSGNETHKIHSVAFVTAAFGGGIFPTGQGTARPHVHAVHG